MKFSIIYEAQMVDTSRENEARVFHEIVEQSLLAEEMGFDTVWAVEHTALTQYAHMSAPETFLAFLAGKTTTLGIGHGVVCLPPAMNHPVKVAERISTLDILSRGRVHFGMGKGGTQQESGTFGYDLGDLPPMITEAMYLIPRIMTEEVIEHDGVYVKIPPREIHPKPWQTPHPPIYMACTKDDGLVTAGERGIGALVLAFSGPAEVERKSKIYRDAYARRDPANQVGFRPIEHLAALCPTIVLADRERAREVGLRGQRFFVESLAHWYQGGPRPSAWEVSAEENAAALAEKKASVVVAYICEERIESRETIHNVADDAYADDCLRQVHRLEAAGADEILFLFQMGGISHADIMETIRIIGEQVIPRYRADKAAA
jgi:alkanesulfonate monooxygenase SsuD/methylene tetrahydromethanopterin reductase-like flavin-dependent oxidoreductase (luciferase family)